MRFLRILLPLSLLLCSCRHSFRVESFPDGAIVEYNSEEVGSTPLEMTVWWWPYRQIPVEVSLPNYRPLTFRADRQINPLRLSLEILSFRYSTLLGIKTRSTHNIQLLREHGPAGSWAPEEAERNSGF